MFWGPYYKPNFWLHLLKSNFGIFWPPMHSTYEHVLHCQCRGCRQASGICCRHGWKRHKLLLLLVLTVSSTLLKIAGKLVNSSPIFGAEIWTNRFDELVWQVFTLHKLPNAKLKFFNLKSPIKTWLDMFYRMPDDARYRWFERMHGDVCPTL